jgi:Ca2+-binding RTX toxin-like protein
MRVTLGAAALLAPALHAQTAVTCNGLPATIVATAPGQITGTQGDDVIVGTAGDDRIFGLGGNDTICGLSGNDQITGGMGNDSLFGQAGNDTFFWFPGDGSDRVEGSSEADILQVTGSSANETVELSANGSRLRLFRNIAAITLDVADVERVNFEARGGSDLVVVNRLVGTGVQQVSLDMEGLENSNTPDGQPDSVIVFGGTGDDQITIGSIGSTLIIAGAGAAIDIRNTEAALDYLSVYGIEGNDQINARGLTASLVKLQVEGGPGNDTITGSQSADALVGGEGDDTFVWTLGLPADLVSGEAGTDTVQIVGSAAADNVTLSPTAFGIQVFNSGNSITFQADVEQAVFQAGRGADQIVINSLAGTALQKITLDLRPAPTGTAGDGYVDGLIVNGTVSADNITITGSTGTVSVSGLSPMILVQGSESLRDTLTVNCGVEADVLNAQGLAAGVIRLAIRGGMGIDNITGSLGDDLFTWSPGDGSDVIDGGLGSDTLQIDGSGASENINLSPNGSRLRFTRDIAAVVLDVNGVERVNFAAQGGTDTISIGDLSGTSVRQVALNLASLTNNAGDGQPGHDTD